MIVHVVRTNPANGTADPKIDEILGDLRGALSELRCVGSERMAKQGVSMTHLHVLSLLEHHSDVAMSRLADLLDVSVSNATGLIDRLEERGFVERERDLGDRRVVHVRLAEGGRTYLREIQIVREELLQKVLSRLDAEQLHCVRSALTSLRSAALSLANDPDIAADWHAHAHAH